LNHLFHGMHQTFINHRRLAALLIIVHIFMSIMKVSQPSFYHWITNDMFFMHLTKLMNVSRFHVSCIQEKGYRPHFTCGGLSDFLEHCKRADNAWMWFDCLQIAPVLSKRANKLCMHAHHSDHRIAVAVFANRTYFVDAPRLYSRFTCDLIIVKCNGWLNDWITSWFYFILQKPQVMVEVTGNQNMVSMMFSYIFKSKLKVCKPLYPFFSFS
jgi:hypothetical protein